MDNDKKMPLWVELGMGAIQSRKTAINLLIACVVFALVFIPFPFILEDWSWLDVLNWSGMTLILAAYYWACVRWIDKNAAWEKR